MTDDIHTCSYYCNRPACIKAQRDEFVQKMEKTSDTTAQLIALLRQRDAAGRAKYGTTLDRTDLTPEQWLQHMAEELLDGAGYALAAMREVARLRQELTALKTPAPSPASTPPAPNSIPAPCSDGRDPASC